MIYRNKWIGYEEGHQEIDCIDEFQGRIFPSYRWVVDFFIRIDSKAIRIEYQGRGVNIFWDSFFHRIQWRVLRSSIREAMKLLKARAKKEK